METEETSTETTGKFVEADKETLKKRRIVKAVGLKKSESSSSSTEEEKKTNPFQSINLAATEETKTSNDDKKSKTPLEKLQAFYKKFNPTKVDTCEKLIKKYEGNEEILFDKLFDKYGTHPDDLDDESSSRFGLANIQGGVKHEDKTSTKLTFGSSDTGAPVGLKLGEIDEKNAAAIEESSKSLNEDTRLKLN